MAGCYHTVNLSCDYTVRQGYEIRELGTDRGHHFGGAPVARIAGHRRLDENEYWDGAQVRCMTNSADAA
jgi:hypothetical protein